MALKVFVCVALLFVGLASCRSFGGSVPSQRRPVVAAPNALRDVRAPVVGTIQQKLDHLNTSDTREWQQRYLINEQFYAIGGPIFVMMSLEGAANPDWLRGGQMMELALLYKAKAFLLEERFYGQSKPMPDTSDDSLQYAAPEQVVDDCAAFIASIKISHPGAKVILFGGSYGGSHVAWVKLKYPELIDGAVASSASLLATYGFPGRQIVLYFMEEVSRVMKLADEACVTDTKEAITAVEDILFGSETGGEAVADLFNLCAPLDATNRLDVGNFFRLFPGVFVIAVETASSLAVVQDTCNLITNPLYGATPLERLVELRASIAQTTDCTEVRYDQLLPFAMNTSLDHPAAQSRNYMHQSCRFYGDFSTSEGKDQPFGNAFPMEGFVQFCKDVYSPRYDAAFIKKAVDETNAISGGQTPAVINTVFVHGSLDPWRVLGVLEDLSETATVIVIEGTSHITDMKTASASDSDELKAARIKIRDLVGEWIS